MKRKGLVIFVGLIFLLLSMSIGQPKALAKTVIKIAHESSVEHNINKAYLFFAKRVEEKTKGDVEIKVFPSGQLGDERAIFEGVKIGTIDAGGGGFGSTMDPRFALIRMPFVFRDYGHVHKVLDGPIGNDLKDRSLKSGYKVMCIFDGGFREFTNNKRPIWGPEDMKGLLMRVPGIPEMVDSIKAFGATTVTVPYGEVYGALRQGVADGEENSLTNITGMKFYECQKYLSVVHYMYDGDTFIMNPKLWNSLSPSNKKMLEEAAAETLAYQRKILKEEEDGALDVVMKAGMKVNLVYQPLFYPLCEEVYKKYEMTVPGSLIEEVRKVK
jgi:tripartite ATP-independent transporter DctP family solute receptor